MAGLDNVFISAILYTGGRYRKKLCPRSSVQDKGRAQDLGHSFFLYDRDRGGGGAGRAAAPPLFCAPAPTFCAKKKNN